MEIVLSVEKYFFTFFEEKKNPGDKLCRFVSEFTERPHPGGSHVRIYQAHTVFADSAGKTLPQSAIAPSAHRFLSRRGGGVYRMVRYFGGGRRAWGAGGFPRVGDKCTVTVTRPRSKGRRRKTKAKKRKDKGGGYLTAHRASFMILDTLRRNTSDARPCVPTHNRANKTINTPSRCALPQGENFNTRLYFLCASG